MRTIKRIFVHCTAGSQKSYNDESLLREFKIKGWKNPGYHYVIRPDGTVFNVLDENKIANGVNGYNSTSIHIAYVGGINSLGKAVDNRTDKQKLSLRLLLEEMRRKYPEAVILGHRDISPDKNNNGKIETWEYIKMCPCFNVMEEFDYLNKGIV